MKISKLIFINILITIFFLLIVEMLIATFYFYKYNSMSYFSASSWLTTKIANEIDRSIALKIAGKRVLIDIDQVLFDPKNTNEKNFSNFLLNSYENHFQKFYDLVNEHNLNLVVLYIPNSNSNKINKNYDNFFKDVANKNKINYISMYELLNIKREDIFLVPYNGHLTRFTNNQIARKINEYIKIKNINKQKSFICEDIKGKFQPNKSQLYLTIPEGPYYLITDEYGFRNTQIESYNKNFPNIFIIGDSFTFGPYMSFHDSYPGALNRNLKDWNVINGGVSSFSIRSEYNLLKDNIECLSPSLIVLQVSNNDIYGMTNKQYNEYNYKSEVLQLTNEEIEFYKYLESKN
ncbi:hypothetical protein OAI01_05870 [Alphaproteobacteria bacterium]|nr:hypothetical protein [Alphaproteobacteria bacterium]